VGALELAVVRDFGIALLIGVLLGIERETRKAREQDVGIGGLRTFVLFAQAGAIGAWLSRTQGTPWIFVVTIAGVIALIVAGYSAQARARPDSIGLTTEMAGVATALLGGMTIFGHAEAAVALAIVSSALLAFKQPLHSAVGRLGTDDIYAGVKLLVASFVVLPLLPNRAVDPLGALNPYELWLLVILISTLSLVGYVAVRWLGASTGTLLTGLFGGLVSSTAITLAFARRSRDQVRARGDAHLIAAGILVAWAVMFVRILVEVAVVHAPLLPRLSVACGLMGAAALAVAGFHWWTATQPEEGGESPGVSLQNPFSLSSAIRFALLFATVLVVVAVARRYGSPGSIYLVAGLAGLTDVDAIALSMAGAARGGQSADVSVSAILIAALANTFTKGALVAAMGASALRRLIVVSTAAVLAAGAAALLFF
jgi:uncharacterized membrane protein (DUF4010 family)